jgi:S-adenosylmethionine:tRNA ribosyltransferase-isomerase
MKTYTSHRRGDATKLLVVGKETRVSMLGRIGEELLEEDVLVVNESGTVPASLRLKLARTGEALEIRLAVREGANEWLVVSFGSGDWRRPTEERGAPPALYPDGLLVGNGLTAKITALDPRHPRLVHLRLEGDLYRSGTPVQYSYHRDPLTLWDTQTPLAGAPWSVEAPSALFPLTFTRLLALKKKFRIVPLLHGAGLSSTGDAALDALFPLPEPYKIPASTIDAVRNAKGRVIAWGTSAARALESYAETGMPEGTTALKLGAQRPARLVHGIITGFHEPGTSHYALEEAFVPRTKLEAAFRAGIESGLLGHEYGDLALVWRDAGAV